MSSAVQLRRVPSRPFRDSRPNRCVPRLHRLKVERFDLCMVFTLAFLHRLMHVLFFSVHLASASLMLSASSSAYTMRGLHAFRIPYKGPGQPPPS